MLTRLLHKLSAADCRIPFHPFLTGLSIFTIVLSVHFQAGAFHIECPPDVTVSCEDELWDLSIYGTATIYGYGSPQPAGDPEWVEYNLNSCNAGTIKRTWVAYDYSGNPYYCSQIITVSGGGNIHIDWPPNYTLHDCSPDTDPHSLPPPYDFPVIQNYGQECTNVLYTWEDQVFNINPPACKKILRKWTVIDWCSYNPHHYPPIGIWHYTQIIKIVPETGPTIECPGDITISTDIDCSSTFVNIPPATGMSDCGASVIITNHSPYAESKGADASGYYPPGVTHVTFKAEDGCGGYTTCTMKVTVKDLKKPTPICYYGISISLMQMPDGYYMALRPEFFDKGSFDNCTPKHKLTFSVEPEIVDCDDLGQTPVKLYVTDEYGNSAYCNTYVSVQDNMGMCPPSNGEISGTLLTPDGLRIDQVEVALEGRSLHQMTDDDGEYRFTQVPYGENYTIKPSMENADLNGISTLDLLFFIRHIMGVELLSSPYQYIAADLNNSSGVSANDMISLRDMILRNQYQLPTGSNWKFIDATHQFDDPFNPFEGGIPESYTIENFSASMEDLNFIGVKLGDLSGDAMQDNGLTDEELRGTPVKFSSLKASYKAGQEFEVRVYGNSFRSIVGYQFTLSFDKAKAEFLGVKQGNLSGLDQNNFGFSRLDEGLIAANWFSLEPPGEDKIAAFSIRFKALKDVNVQDILELTSDILHPEAYNASLERLPVELNFIQSNISEGYEGNGDPFEALPVLGEVSVFPNPFNLSTSIGFNLSARTDVSMMLYDVNGKQLYEQGGNFAPGYHQIPVNRQDIGFASGIVFCDLITREDKKTVKIMILDNP